MRYRSAVRDVVDVVDVGYLKRDQMPRSSKPEGGIVARKALGGDSAEGVSKLRSGVSNVEGNEGKV